MKINSHPVDLSKLIKSQHRQKWVALNQDQDRVLAFGKNLKVVLENAKQLGESKPILTFAVDNYQGLVS